MRLRVPSFVNPLVALLAVACAARRPAPAPVFPISPGWTTPLGESIDGPLAGDGSRVFVATRDGRVRALDALTGALLWQVSTGTGALSTGPSLLVVRQPDGVVLGLDPTSGATRFKASTNVAGRLPALVDAERLFVAGVGVAALAPGTGAVLWSASDGAEATALPSTSGACLFVPEADGTLRCRDVATGTTKWRFPTAHALLASPVTDTQDRLFVGTTDRRFLALDARDGRARWRWKLGADAQTPAVLFAGQVIFATHEAVLYALDRGGGNLAWRAALPSRPFSGPLLSGRTVLVPCHGTRPQESTIVGFDARTGARLGDVKTLGELRSPPLLLGDRLFLALRNRSVTALQLGVGPVPVPSATPTPPVERD